MNIIIYHNNLVTSKDSKTHNCSLIYNVFHAIDKNKGNKLN